ncbi:MAG: ABC transporter permease [Candidatus Marinimicrobia bacterium]|nr:ABC transporter permease [Candidatus Neomarinimicrobiota bacterium]
MLKHYLISTLRRLGRAKGFTAINIIGMSVGLTGSVLALLLVRYELSFDKYHERLDRIHLVVNRSVSASGKVDHQPWLPLPLGPELLATSTEIVRSARLTLGEVIVHGGSGSFEEDILFGEPYLFEMLSFAVIAGDPVAALAQPDGLVMTRQSAMKHFGTVDLIGQPVSLTTEAGRREFRVLGVVENPPAQSTLQFQMVLPLQAWLTYTTRALNWNASNTHILVETAGPVGKFDLTDTFLAILLKNRSDRAPVTDQGEIPTGRRYWNLSLLPFVEAHLSPQYASGLLQPVDPQNLMILAGFAAILLIIAIFNFMLLALGRLQSRFKEVGVRRVVGANGADLTAMFMGEVLLTALFALGISFLILELTLPSFNKLLGRDLALTTATDLGFWASLLLLVGILVLAAGLYPARKLASLQPVQALHGIDPSNPEKRSIQLGVILQISLTIIILVAALVINKQMKFIQEQPLGFNESQVVLYKIATEMDELPLWSQRLKEVLSRDSGVQSVAKVSYSVNRGWNRLGWRDNAGKPWRALVKDVDEDYLKTMEIALLSGRDLAAQDGEEAMLVNEAFVEAFGLDEPIGYVLDGFAGDADRDPTIIGVFSDFHFFSLRSEVAPMILWKNPAEYYQYLLARIAADDVSGTLQRLGDSWKRAAPGIPLNYNFLDEDIQALYIQEQKLQAVTRGAAILALTLSAMGLLGMATIEISRRTKEIGIRKVLGASVPEIMGLLSRRMVVSSLLANIIAWPVAWIVMQKWLGSFAYRIELGPGILLGAASLALLVSLLTLGTLAMRAATANPVDSLRYE